MKNWLLDDGVIGLVDEIEVVLVGDESEYDVDAVYDGEEWVGSYES